MNLERIKTATSVNEGWSGAGRKEALPEEVCKGWLVLTSFTTQYSLAPTPPTHTTPPITSYLRCATARCSRTRPILCHGHSLRLYMRSYQALARSHPHASASKAMTTSRKGHPRSVVINHQPTALLCNHRSPPHRNITLLRTPRLYSRPTPPTTTLGPDLNVSKGSPSQTPAPSNRYQD